MSTHKVKGEDYYQCRAVKAERDSLLKTVHQFKECLSELVCIVEIHSEATSNNFAWAELEEAKRVLTT